MRSVLVSGAVLHAEAWAAALTSRLALRLLPFSRVLRIAERRGRRPAPRPAPAPEEIAAAVRRAGRLVPGSSCLSRAVAAHALLTRAGHPSRLKIGLRQVCDGTVQGHAWIESSGKVVLGADEREAFVPLPTLETR